MCEATMKTSRLVTRVAMFASAAFSFLNASAADIVSVTGAQRNGQEIVQIELDESIDFSPSAFVVQSPARISLDFPSVGVKSGRQNVEVNQGNLRSINVVEAGDRSRVVLNLREATAYQIQRSGSLVTVVLNPAIQANSTVDRSHIGKIDGHSSSPAQQASAASGLKNIDFRKGVDGAGRLILSMPSEVTEVDLRQEGRKIVLEIPNAALSPALRNRLDVMDFGTPVQFIQARQVGNSTLVEVETVGEWSQSAYQADGQYVLELREVVPDPTKLTQGLGFTGEKLSLNFQNIEIRSLLQVIADFTNFNIVTSDSVQGSLTLRLQDVPWDQAFQIILDSKALGYEKNGNVLWVAPKQELDARKQQDYEAQLALQKLEPLRTQIFQLNYAKADYIAQQLTGSGSSVQVSGDANNNRFLTARGSAIAEKRTNQLFVTDTPSRLEDVTRLIASWDIPVRQVLIEARIVEATDNFGRNLGVRLGASDLRAERGGEGGYNIGGGNSVVVGGSYNNVLTSSGAAAGTSANGQFFNFGAADIGTASAATFALSIFNSAANRFLNLELSALEATGQGRVISSPRIVTADQVEAFIEQGTEIPYATTSPNGASTVEFKKAVMRLGVTPQITPEGNVILDLEVNKDSPTVSAGAVAVDTKKVTTQVLVENGGTVVIGGIFELIESTGETKVPFLGDLPIAGHLFKSTTRSVTKSELMVFITPKIVTDQNSMRR